MLHCFYSVHLKNYKYSSQPAALDPTPVLEALKGIIII